MRYIELDLGIGKVCKGQPKRFIKRPKKGDIAKIHYSDRTYRVGIVEKVEPDNGRDCNRERLVLRPTNKTFELNDFDYILEESRARFMRKKK